MAQEALGLAPGATFVAAPDLTVTRNHSRWRSGCGYGGRLTWGDGLYWDWSETLQRKADILETPFGPLRLLTSQAARDYYAFCRQAEGFAKKRRLLVARRLFDDMTPYNNETHQGLMSMNDMVLGSYLVTEEGLETVRLGEEDMANMFAASAVLMSRIAADCDEIQRV